MSTSGSLQGGSYPAIECSSKVTKLFVGDGKLRLRLATSIIL